ncbi:MAG: hypothetical protein GY810_12455 [Aureispira sp.]|nr:hypothetical protein [Aureispira sp.]
MQIFLMLLGLFFSINIASTQTDQEGIDCALVQRTKKTVYKHYTIIHPNSCKNQELEFQFEEKYRQKKRYKEALKLEQQDSTIGLAIEHWMGVYYYDSLSTYGKNAQAKLEHYQQVIRNNTQQNLKGTWRWLWEGCHDLGCGFGTTPLTCQCEKQIIITDSTLNYYKNDSLLYSYVYQISFDYWETHSWWGKNSPQHAGKLKILLKDRFYISTWGTSDKISFWPALVAKNDHSKLFLSESSFHYSVFWEKLE